jgi:uncharacterized membrane protein YhaH (DUF805 family)
MLLGKFISAFFSARGRATRSQWLSRMCVIALICAAFGSLSDSWFGETGSSAFAIVFLWSAIAVGTQRLHDIGHSGWTLIKAVIPVAGPIWVLIYWLRRGVNHENRFGPDPATRSDYLQVDIGK